MVANFPRVRGSLIDIRRPLLWVRRLACQQGRLYSKTYASFSSLLGSTSTPKEGVASASFTQITFSSHPGFTESRDVNDIYREFACDQCCASVGSVCSVYVEKLSNVPRYKVRWDDPCFLLVLFVISTACEGPPPAAVNWLGKGETGYVWVSFSNQLRLPWRWAVLS